MLQFHTYHIVHCNYFSWFAFCYCDQTLTKNNLGEERVNSIQLLALLHHQGKPRQKLKTGTQEQELKHWNTALWLFQLSLLYNLRSLSRASTAHRGMGTFPSIISQDNTLQIFPQTNLTGNSSVEGPSSQVTSVYVQLTNTCIQLFLFNNLVQI